MIKYLALLVLLISFAGPLDAQKYFTKDGYVRFYSDAPLEKIEAENKKLTCVMDTETGQIQFAVLMKSFHFAKALMEEHFNENYVESNKYPKAVFTGQIESWKGLDLSRDGEYPVRVQGAMTMHGVERPELVGGLFIVQDGTISATSTFMLSMADYNIEIPNIVVDNIAQEVEVTVRVDLTHLEQ